MGMDLEEDVGNIEDIGNDEGFKQYMYKEYLKSKNIKKAKEDIVIMLSTMKKLSGEQARAKYGKPEQVFAKLQWELYKAKNSIIDCDKCKTYHEEDGDCIKLKRKNEGGKSISTKSYSGVLTKG